VAQIILSANASAIRNGYCDALRSDGIMATSCTYSESQAALIASTTAAALTFVVCVVASACMLRKSQ